MARAASTIGMDVKFDAANKTLLPLSLFWRWYIYALHGYFSEIAFTAAWEFAVSQKFTLMGSTSLWTMPIYGVSGLVVEKLHLKMNKLRVHLLLRGVVYLVWTYIWEFSAGYVLRLFGACPWDYASYDWDFLGLICLEYAPFWYMASYIVDQLVIPYTLHLHWVTPGAKSGAKSPQD